MDVLLVLTLKAAIVVVGLAAIFGDTATAAAIAGIFSTINLVLNTAILRKTGEAKHAATTAAVAATSPRRFVYDADGKILGSIPEAARGELADYQPFRDAFHAAAEGKRWTDAP